MHTPQKKTHTHTNTTKTHRALVFLARASWAALASAASLGRPASTSFRSFASAADSALARGRGGGGVWWGDVMWGWMMCGVGLVGCVWGWMCGYLTDACRPPFSSFMYIPTHTHPPTHLVEGRAELALEARRLRLELADGLFVCVCRHVVYFVHEMGKIRRLEPPPSPPSPPPNPYNNTHSTHPRTASCPGISPFSSAAAVCPACSAAFLRCLMSRDSASISRPSAALSPSFFCSSARICRRRVGGKGSGQISLAFALPCPWCTMTALIAHTSITQTQ